MTPNTEMADPTEFLAVLVLSHDTNKGSCMIWMPTDSGIKFENIGRDGDGGYLQTDAGDVVRITADNAQVDELLSREDILIQQMDEDGLIVSVYAITPVDADNRIGFNA